MAIWQPHWTGNIHLPLSNKTVFHIHDTVWPSFSELCSTCTVNSVYTKSVIYLVGYEGGDPVFSPVGVDKHVVLSPQCFGPCLGCDGLLEGLVQKLGAWVQTEWLDGWLSAFTVDVYLERTSLTGGGGGGGVRWWGGGREGRGGGGGGGGGESIQLVLTLNSLYVFLSVFVCIS